ECERFLRTNRRPLVRGVVGLHASFTVSDETIREAATLARDLGSVLHVHVAEDMADVEDARTRGYPGPLARLRDLGALPPGSVLAHGVHLSPEQVREAEQLGCWLVHNPRSNEGNRVGYAGNLQFASKIALGTDGWNADMAEEEAALVRLAKDHGDNRAAGRLAGGHALIAERFRAVSELAPGALGDAVVWENEKVRHSIVGGRVAVEDGRLIGGNIDVISRAARDSALGLWERMAAI
ncbi:MAG: amidohydrolase family protein, partial [Betaproteobacteria bacterium]|nr:amidohydrolase family protein [Betaproteobacteria bacterium]